jgi:hypothetical protein
MSLMALLSHNFIAVALGTLLLGTRANAVLPAHYFADFEADAAVLAECNSASHYRPVPPAGSQARVIECEADFQSARTVHRAAGA